MQQLAKKLQAAATKKGLGVRELSRRIGVSPSTVGRWLHGEAIPEESRLADLARHLSLPVAELRKLHKAAVESAERPNHSERISALEDDVARIEATLNKLTDLVRQPVAIETDEASVEAER